MFNLKQYNMKRILLLSFMFTFVFAFSAMAQRTVSGQITSAEDGGGLPGVNVVLKGTTTGTTSDLDGNYTLSVPEDGGVLVFSFIGLESQEINIGARSVIDVAMSADVQQLTEVVVTALGVSREKRSIGYSTQEVDGEQVAEAREPNIVNALQGEIAGVQIQGTSGAIGGSSRITIRGVNSVTGNNQPLFVVDGVPVSNNNLASNSQQRGFGGGQAYDYGNFAQDINPADVESINVLKGAAATALYGVRGSNGVILITTKSGKGTKGIGVSVNSSVSFENPLALIDHQQEYGGGATVSSTNSGFIEFNQDGQAYLAPVYAKDGSWGPKYNPSTQVRHWDSWDENSPNYKETRPWVAPENGYEEFFETGVTTTNSVALEGSNESGNFRLGYTLVDQSGIMPNQGLGRHTIALNAGYNLTEKLKITTSANYIRQDVNGRNITGYNNGNPMQAFTQWWQTQLDVKRLEDNYLKSDGTQYTWNPIGVSTDANGDLISFNPRPQFFDNPYFARNEFLQEDTRDRLIGNIEFSYQFTDNLTASFKAMRDGYSFSARSGVPQESVDQSLYREQTINFDETNFDARLMYNQTFGDVSVNLIVGGNSMHQVQTSTTVSTTGGIALDKFWNLSNSLQPATITPRKDEQAINSVYAIGSFGWRNIVFLDASIRNDWASTLPEEENPFQYPSVSTSFVFSELPLFDSDILSFGKLRAGYGIAANAPGPYQLVNGFNPLTPNFGSNPRYAVPNARNNPNLGPETTTEYELGVELNFFQGRASVDVAYYNRETEDQIINVDVSASTGFTSRQVNAGTMRNSGFEIMLNVTPLIIGDFSWDISANLATYDNEVVELAPGIQSIGFGGTWAAELRAQEGFPYMAMFGEDFVRDDNGNIVVDANGFPEATGERVFLGTAIADYTGGVRNTFNWKGLSASVLMDFQKGGSIHSTSLQWANYSGMTDETVFQDGVDIRQEGYLVPGSVNGDGSPNTTRIPAQQYFQSYWFVATPNIYNAGFLKLREIKLSYQLPSSLLSGTPFKQVSVGAFGRNLAILNSDLPYLDPQVVTGTGNVQGLENAQVPSTRSYGFNLGFKF